jgi:hypothetical protein
MTLKTKDGDTLVGFLEMRDGRSLLKIEGGEEMGLDGGIAWTMDISGPGGSVMAGYSLGLRLIDATDEERRAISESDYSDLLRF